MRCTVLLATLLATSYASAQEPWKKVVNLTPIADTWATHDDKTLHGNEPTMKVGHEPQGCQTGVLGYDPCPIEGKVCCKPEGEFAYNYCAVEGHCETTTPEWEASRSFRGYLKFDLSSVPKGTIMNASLRLRQVALVEHAGGPLKVVVTRLKDIQAGGCGWTEATLNDTNLTTWSSLPQNLSKSPDGVWSFEVTKAVRDWLTGDEDFPNKPLAPNCGFHLYDPDYPKSPKEPLIRWVLFGTKESNSGAVLSITVAMDLDGDGYTGDRDCNENDPKINPGVTDICDGLDNDCSGGTDDEVCDGVDNNCDGATDEGEHLCPAGLVCIAGKCEKSCEDECDSPYDLACREKEGGGWEVLHCQHTLEDACLHMVPVETCPEGWLCNFGSCSKNCVDDFDCEVGLEGTKKCQKDLAGRWFVATCGNYDSDECLEWGAMVPCGKGAPCENATCGAPCEDECTVGDRKCTPEGRLTYCWNFDGDPCWEWGGETSCSEGAFCEKGVCVTPCQDECEKDSSRCVEQDGVAGVQGCVQVGKCTKWGPFQACASGKCEDGACLAPCKDDCLWEGATECVDDVSMRTCIKGPEGCLVWAEPTQCPGGCAGGACAGGKEEETAETIEPEASAEEAGPIVEKPDAAMIDTATPDIADLPSAAEHEKSGSSGGCNASSTSGVVVLLIPVTLALRPPRRRET